MRYLSYLPVVDSNVFEYSSAFNLSRSFNGAKLTRLTRLIWRREDPRLALLRWCFISALELEELEHNLDTTRYPQTLIPDNTTHG